MTKEEIAALVAASVADAVKSALSTETTGGTKAKELFAPNINRGIDDRDNRTGVQKMGAFVKFMAMSKGDPERAAKVAKELGDDYISKALTTTDFTAGGALIPTQFLDDYFTALRPRSMIRNLGARVIDLIDGSATMPGITGGSTASYKEESAAARAGAVQTGQVHLTEKELISIIPVSLSMYRSRSGRNADMVAEDMLNGMAQAETEKFLNGTGANATPIGILNQALDANTTAASGATLLDADTDISALPNVLYTAGVMVTKGVYFMDSTLMTNLQRLRSGDMWAYPEMRQGKLNGFAYDHSNSVPSGTLAFANMDDIIIGDSQMIEVAMSEEAAYVDQNGVMQAAFSRNEVVMKLTAKHDIAMRYNQSLAAKTGATYAGA